MFYKDGKVHSLDNSYPKPKPFDGNYVANLDPEKITVKVFTEEQKTFVINWFKEQGYYQDNTMPSIPHGGLGLWADSKQRNIKYFFPLTEGVMRDYNYLFSEFKSLVKHYEYLSTLQETTANKAILFDKFLEPLETSVEVSSPDEEKIVVEWFGRHGFTNLQLLGWQGNYEKTKKLRLEKIAGQLSVTNFTSNSPAIHLEESSQKENLTFSQFQEKTEQEDWRKCIDANGVNPNFLTLNKPYLVLTNTKVHDIHKATRLSIKTDSGLITNYSAARFERMDDWRECISVDGRLTDLTVGKFYKIFGCSSFTTHSFFVVVINNFGEKITVNANRFKKINTNMEKKIIGYEAPFDMKTGIKKGDVFISVGNGTLYYSAKSPGIGICIPAEIVEKDWAPVYEKTGKKILLGYPAREFTIEKGIITVKNCGNRDIRITRQELLPILNCKFSLGDETQINLIPEKFEVDGIFFTRGEVDKLIKEYDAINKTYISNK